MTGYLPMRKKFQWTNHLPAVVEFDFPAKAGWKGFSLSLSETRQVLFETVTIQHLLHWNLTFSVPISTYFGID